MAMVFVLFMIAVAASTLCKTGCARSSTFDINIRGDGSYSLAVNGITWLNSGDTEFRGDGRTFSTSNGSLQLISSSTGHGSDQFGTWSFTNFIYQAGTFRVNASIKVYTESTIPAAIFSQTYLDNAFSTSAPTSDDLISKFPSFKLEQTSLDLGYLAYAGNMAGYSSLSIGRFLPLTYIQTGIKGGPVVIFDNSSNAIVISPLSQFMAVSNDIDFLSQISWGIMGLVNSVPNAYRTDFVVYYSSQGINQAMRDWGHYMTTFYEKSSEPRKKDPTIQYMGYWTDNGCTYYV